MNLDLESALRRVKERQSIVKEKLEQAPEREQTKDGDKPKKARKGGVKPKKDKSEGKAKGSEDQEKPRKSKEDGKAEKS